MDAMVSISLTELDKLRGNVEEARAETAKVRMELAEERARPADARLSQAYRFAGAAKEVIDYAVGNLSPEFSRGWPYESLRQLAQDVGTLGEVTPRDKERALLWDSYVEQIVEQDRAWALGKNVDARVAAVVSDALPKGPSKDEYLAAVERGQRSTPAWLFALLFVIGALVSWGLLKLL